MRLSFAWRAAVVVLTFLLIDSTSAVAVFLVNGDFSQGLTGYSWSYGDNPSGSALTTGYTPNLGLTDTSTSVYNFASPQGTGTATLTETLTYPEVDLFQTVTLP